MFLLLSSEQKVTVKIFVLTRVLFVTASLTIALLSKIKQLLKSWNDNEGWQYAVADLGGGMGGMHPSHQPKSYDFGRKISPYFE